MAKRFNEKREKALLASIDRELDSGYGAVDTDAIAALDSRDAAMGKGELELFEKKMSKEEKKAAAKAAREAKKKIKGSKSSDNMEGMDGTTTPAADGEEKKSESGMPAVKSEIDMAALEAALNSTELTMEERQNAAMEWLSSQQIAVTYTPKKGKIHANTRDINVSGVTVNFHGKPLIEETEVIINYGNRYGFIGPNGSGKVRICDGVIYLIFGVFARFPLSTILIIFCLTLSLLMRTWCSRRS